MDNMQELLRGIPHVDKLLHSEEIERSGLPRALVTEHVRAVLADAREHILSGAATSVPDTSELCRAALSGAQAEYDAGIRPVVNGTGVVLHSNLGRACLSDAAVAAVTRTAAGFSSLEYDLCSGRRGSRTAVAELRLRRLTGAQAALIVNNNAAAVLLILTTLSGGGNVIVSRGELVEIGGSFRIPEIMAQCGCELREVGTTNKTRADDYERAIDAGTRALLKVHTSNFRITGFTEAATVKELSAIARRHGLPVIDDIGSCSLTALQPYGVTDEPDVASALLDGADVVCFSGDKLLGGPQCGVILGGSRYLAAMRVHPLYRALRTDKMTIAALEETLRAYMEPGRAERELPVLAMLAAQPEMLREKAERLCAMLRARGAEAEVVPVISTVGGGSVPGQELPSFAVAPAIGSGAGAVRLERALLALDRPIIGRIVRDAYLIDVRTVFETELEYIAGAIGEIIK